jgi:predicted amidohydrolase
MSARFVAAVVQLTSTSDEEANWQSASQLVERAAAAGARLVATPENTNFLGPHEEKVRRAEPLGGQTAGSFAALARRLGIHLLLGSFNERSSDPARCHNTSVLFGPEGQVLAIYRKLHLFDVDIPGGVRFAESDTCKPGATGRSAGTTGTPGTPGTPETPAPLGGTHGDTAADAAADMVCGEGGVVVAATPLGRIGMTICYDLRFAELYRRLAELGADLLTVPSAFTLTTGKDHWEPLLRARAIENQCYVLAPAQHGAHDDGGLRESYGHAMIVDPWGLVVAMASDGPGFALAEIDLDRVERVRQAIPVRRHRRL